MTAKKIIQYILGAIIAVVISYSIASVLILGQIGTPISPFNDAYIKRIYSHTDIIEMTDNAQVISGAISVNNYPKGMIDINYPNDRTDKYGYVMLDIDLISEENVDANINIIRKTKEDEVVSVKLNEGINLIKLPLDDAAKIKIYINTGIPVKIIFNDIKVTNQLLSILPGSWYLCFLMCLILCAEMLLTCIGVKKKDVTKQTSKIGSLGKNIKNNINNNIEKFFAFFKEYKWAFLICLGICIFAYGYNLTNFSLGVDEERDIVRSLGTLDNIKELLVREGRYGLYLFRCLETVDGSFTPFVGELIAVISIFLNIMVATKVFEIAAGKKIRCTAVVVFGGMLATLPFINAEIMCYSIMNAGVYFSMMMTTLALWGVASYFENKNKYRLVMSVLLTSVAMMFLESHNVWFITGTVLINLIWVMSDREINFIGWIKYVMHYVVVFVVSFVAYTIVKNIMGENGYVSNYIMWGTDDPIIIIKQVMDWIIDTLTNQSLPGAVYLFIAIVLFVGFILTYVFKQNKVKAVLTLLLSLCFLITPFFLCIVAGNKMPYRTMETLILLEAGAWLVILNHIDKKLITRYVLLAASLLIIWNQGVWMNRIFYGADINARLDMEMGYAIGEEIEKVSGKSRVDKPVVFVGRVQHDSANILRIDAVGQSVFFRNRSSYKNYYMRHLGFKFIQPTNEQVTSAEVLALEMNAWPLEGSVKEFDDMIIVKLK